MSKIHPNSSDENKFFQVVIDLGLYSNLYNLRNYLNSFYSKNILRNKRVLDIGGGIGLLSFWVASNGGSAICLEPEFDGSSKDMKKNFVRLSEALSFTAENPQLISTTFQEYNASVTFDIIALGNSINHLNEDATIILQEDPEAYSEYLSYFKKFNNLLKSGGRLIITDCGRHNFFDMLGLRSPFMPSIEWHKHQNPKFWKRLITEAGFKDISISWSAPNRFGPIGKFLLGNRFVAFLLMGHFRIEATKY